MINKKTISFISTIMILIFHLWINVTTNTYESFIRYMCVIGVDLFFFISAYSLASKEKIEYKSFLINRFINIYLKFLIFTIIYTLYAGKDLEFFIKTILFINLFVKGGGSFLWFVPAIMIVYILLPLYMKFEDKHKILSIISISIIYLVFEILISTFTKYNSIFIFTNRIPIILIGYYVSKYKIIDKISNKYLYYIITLLLLVLGTYLSYNYGYKIFKVEWFYDIKYIIYIPLILGIVLLIGKIKSNKITNMIATSSLEIYAIQMIVGFKIANKVFKSINNALISNIVTILIIILLSVVFNKLFNLIKKKLKST